MFIDLKKILLSVQNYFAIDAFIYLFRFSFIALISTWICYKVCRNVTIGHNITSIEFRVCNMKLRMGKTQSYRNIFIKLQLSSGFCI